MPRTQSDEECRVLKMISITHTQNDEFRVLKVVKNAAYLSKHSYPSGEDGVVELTLVLTIPIPYLIFQPDQPPFYFMHSEKRFYFPRLGKMIN